MTGQHDELLNKAFELIELDQHDEAQRLLRKVLESNRDNPDAWWLYAHAVNDPETARLALGNVLSLDHTYPEAAQLLATLEVERSASSETGDLEPAFLPPVPGMLPRETLSGESVLHRRNGGLRRPLLLLAAITLLVAVGVFVVVFRPFGGGPDPQATVTPKTDVTEMQTLSDETLTAIEQGLSAFQMPENGISVMQTRLGNTLTASVCGTAGPEVRSSLPGALQALASQSKQAESLVAAIGVRFLNCDDQTDLLFVGVPIQDAIGFSTGQFDQKSFQATWQRLD